MKGLRANWSRHVLLILGLLLGLSCAHTSKGQAIHIRDDSGVDLVVFYPDGNISILYGTILMGPEADLTTEPEAGEFAVENAQGEVVFRVPSDTAHVHVKGTIEQGITSRLSPSDPAFKVEDSKGEIVAYIDDAGNLKTKGIIFLQGVPTDGIRQRGNTFTRASGDFNYTDFTSTDGLVLSGDASVIHGSLNFTSGQTVGEGAVWSDDKIPVGIGFEVQFDFRLIGDGIEGLSFVIQNDSQTPPLSPGGKLGYTGIVNSLAVEFDTRRTLEFSPPEINGNHISVNTRGPNTANSSDPAFSIGSNYSLSSNLKENTTHTARIVYDSLKDSLKVYLNDKLEVEISSFDLNDHLEMVNGFAWVGKIVTSSRTDKVWSGNSKTSK